MYCLVGNEAVLKQYTVMNGGASVVGEGKVSHG